MFTEHHHIIFEVVSALQKSIRRGLESDAYYWALELAPGFESFLWRRLTVIANEDIGLADLPTVMFVNSQRASWWAMRMVKDDAACYMILSTTILAMCRAPKTRLADHFLVTTVTAQAVDAPHAIPDFALDKHTLRGKQMGRGMEHFLTEGAVLARPAHVCDPYAESARSIWLSDTFPGLPELKPLSRESRQLHLLDTINAAP